MPDPAKPDPAEPARREDPGATRPDLGAAAECWCEEACRYVDLMLDRQEEERQLHDEDDEPGKSPPPRAGS